MQLSTWVLATLLAAAPALAAVVADRTESQSELSAAAAAPQARAVSSAGHSGVSLVQAGPSSHRAGRAGLFGEQPQLGSALRPAIVTPINNKQQPQRHQITPDQIEEVRYSAVQTSKLDLQTPLGTVRDLETSESAVTPTQHQPAQQNGEAEYDPYQLFPQSFHELLDIPIHVYKNGTEIRTLKKRPPSAPMISGGYANTQVQGYGTGSTRNSRPRYTTLRTTTTKRPTTQQATTTPKVVTTTTTERINFVTTTPRAKIVTPGQKVHVAFGERVPAENRVPVTVRPSHELNDRFSTYNFGANTQSHNTASTKRDNKEQPEKEASAAYNTGSQSEKSTRLSLYEKLKRKRAELKTRDRVPYIPRASEPNTSQRPRTTTRPAFYQSSAALQTNHPGNGVQNGQDSATRETSDYDDYEDEPEYDDGYPAIGKFPQYAEFGQRKDNVQSRPTVTKTTTTEAVMPQPTVQSSPFNKKPPKPRPNHQVRDTPARLPESTTKAATFYSKTTSGHSSSSSAQPDVTKFKTRKPWTNTWTKKPIFDKPQEEEHTTSKYQKPLRVTTVDVSETERHGGHNDELVPSRNIIRENTEATANTEAQLKQTISEADYEGGFRPQTSFPSLEETSQSNPVILSDQQEPPLVVKPLPDSHQNGEIIQSTQEPFEPFFPASENQDTSIQLTESPNLKSGPGGGIQQLAGPSFNRPPSRGQVFNAPPRRPGNLGGFKGRPNRPRPGFVGQRHPPGRVDGPGPVEGPHRPFVAAQRPINNDGRPVRRPRPRPTPAPSGGGYLNSLLSWFRGGKDDASLFQSSSQYRPGQVPPSEANRQESAPLGDEVQGYAGRDREQPQERFSRYPTSQPGYTRYQFREITSDSANLSPPNNGGQRKRGSNEPPQRRRIDFQRRRGPGDTAKVNTLQMMHPKLSRPSIPQVLRAPLPEEGYVIADPSVQLRRRRVQGPMKRASHHHMPPPLPNSEAIAYKTRIYEVRPSPTPRRRLNGIQDRLFLAAPTMRAATLLDHKRVMVVGPFVNPPPGAPHINYPAVLGSSTDHAEASKTSTAKSDVTVSSKEEHDLQGDTGKATTLALDKSSNGTSITPTSENRKNKLSTPKPKAASGSQIKLVRKNISKSGQVVAFPKKSDHITIQVGHSATFAPTSDKNSVKSTKTRGQVLSADLTSDQTAAEAFREDQTARGSSTKSLPVRSSLFKTSSNRKSHIRTSTARSWPAAFFRTSSNSAARFAEKTRGRSPVEFNTPELYSGFEPMMN